MKDGAWLIPPMHKKLLYVAALLSAVGMSALAQEDPAAARLPILNKYFKEVKAIEANTKNNDPQWQEDFRKRVADLAETFLMLPKNEIPLAEAKKMDTPYAVLPKFSWQELKERPPQPAFLEQIEETDANGGLEAGKPIFRELPPGSSPQALRSAQTTALQKIPMGKRKMPEVGYELVADECDWPRLGVAKIHENWKTIEKYRADMEAPIASLNDFAQGKAGNSAWVLDETSVAKMRLTPPPECAPEIADMLTAWNSLCSLYLPLVPADEALKTWHKRVGVMNSKLDELKIKGAALAEGKKKEDQMKLLEDMKAKLLPQYQLVQRLCLAAQEVGGYGAGLRADLEKQLKDVKGAYGKYAAAEASDEPQLLQDLNEKWKSVQLTLLRLVRLEFTLYTLAREVGERMEQYQKLLVANREQMLRWIDVGVQRRAAHAMADWQEAKSSAIVRLEFNDPAPFIQELNFQPDLANLKTVVYPHLLSSSKPLEFEPWTLTKVAQVMGSDGTQEKGKPRVFFGSRIKLSGQWKVTGKSTDEILSGEPGKLAIPSIFIIALDASFAPDFDLHVVEGGKFILVTQQMLGIDAGPLQDGLLPTIAQWPTFRTEKDSGIYLQTRLNVPLICRRHGQALRANADDDILLKLRERIWGQTIYDQFYYQLASRIGEELSLIDKSIDENVPKAVELASTLLRAKPPLGNYLDDYSKKQLPLFVTAAKDTLNVERLVVISGRYPHGIPALQVKQAIGTEKSRVVPLPGYLRLASSFTRQAAVGTGKFQGNTIQFSTGPIELAEETQLFSRAKAAIERSGSAYAAQPRSDAVNYVAELDPDRFTAFEQRLTIEGVLVERNTGTGGVVKSFTVKIAGPPVEVYQKLLKLYSPHPAIKVPVRVVTKTENPTVLPGGKYEIPFSFRFILPNAEVEDMIAKNVLVAPAEGDYLVRVPPPAIDEAIMGEEDTQPTPWELNFQALRLANFFPGKGGIQGALLDTVRSTITIEQPAGPPGAWQAKQGYGPHTLQGLLSKYPDGLLKLMTFDKQLRVTLVARSQRTDKEEMVTLSDEFQFGKVHYVDVEKRIAEKYAEQSGQ